MSSLSKVARGSAVVAAIAIITAACGGGSDDSGDNGGSGGGGDDSVVIGVSEEVATLDPQARELYIIGAVTDWNIYEALLQRDPEGELQPLLAASMPTQVDETTWQVELRDDVEFTNGEPFNAEAAAYSINRIIDPDFASEKLPRLTGIVSASAVDDYTVEIKTEAADPILPSRIELIMMVPPEYAETADFANAPVGTGPYLWKSGIGRGPVILEANPDYWGGSTDDWIQNVEYRVIPDAATRISAVQAGEVDLIMDVSADSVDALPQALSATSLENNLVTLNSRAGITSDVRVRQALNYAIDKDAMADDLWSGYAAPAKCQAVAPTTFGYDDELEPYPYDPEKAKDLLDEAGATGSTITLVGQSQIFPEGQEMAEVIAAYWEEAGLKVDLQMPEVDPYLDNLYAEGEDRADGVYLQTTTELGDAASVVDRVYVTDTDIAAYSNPTVDALAKEAASELDPATREGIYGELLKTACDDAAHVFLLTNEKVYGASDSLQWTPRVDAKIIISEMTLA